MLFSNSGFSFLWKSLFFVFVFAIFFIVGLYTHFTSQGSSRVLAQNTEEIVLDSTDGAVVLGNLQSTREFQFVAQLVNPRLTSLTVTVNPTCSCVLDCPKSLTIGPRQESQLRFVIDLEQAFTAWDREQTRVPFSVGLNLDCYSNSDNNRWSKQVILSANVTKVLVAEPEYVHLVYDEIADSSSPQTFDFTVHALEDVAEISVGHDSAKGFESAVVEKVARERFKVNGAVPSGLSPGNHEFHMAFDSIDDLGVLHEKVLDVPVYITVSPDVVALPESVAFAVRGDADEYRPAILTLQSASNRIVKAEVVSSPDFVTVSQESAIESSKVIFAVRLSRLVASSEFGGMIQFRVHDDREQSRELAVPVVVRRMD